jgi:hypothetical protein
VIKCKWLLHHQQINRRREENGKWWNWREENAETRFTSLPSNENARISNYFNPQFVHMETLGWSADKNENQSETLLFFSFIFAGRSRAKEKVVQRK